MPRIITHTRTDRTGSIVELHGYTSVPGWRPWAESCAEVEREVAGRQRGYYLRPAGQEWSKIDVGPDGLLDDASLALVDALPADPAARRARVLPQTASPAGSSRA